MLYNSNLSASQNVQANIVANNMARGRWGNRFKKYFNRHIDTIGADYPAYSFKEGMKDCTNADGSTQERLDEAKDFKNSLVALGDGAFTIVARNTTPSKPWDAEGDINIDSVIFSDEDAVFDVDLKYWLEETILEKNLFDFEKYPLSLQVATLEIETSIIIDYLNGTIVELENYSTDESRANDDLELINHLGLCDSLKNEIDRPHKIKDIWFRFKKDVTPTKLYNNDIFIGYDPAYAWWEEEQFAEIAKKVKNFKDYCTFVVGVDDGSTSGAYTDSYVYVNVSFLLLSGQKIYWLVKTFLDIKVTAKKNLFVSILGAILFVVAIYLTAISANPAWLKAALIVASIASYSGALSSDAKLALLVVTFAYGAYSADFGNMTTLEMFNWAVENIDLVLGIFQEYKYGTEDRDTNKEENDYEEQQRAINFIYNDSYDSYKIYDEMYDDLISVSVEI